MTILAIILVSLLQLKVATEDTLIEQRLEQMMGLEDDYNDQILEETEPPIHTVESLLEDLGDQSDKTVHENIDNSCAQVSIQESHDQQENKEISENISINTSLQEQPSTSNIFCPDDIPMLDDLQEPQSQNLILRPFSTKAVGNCK